MVFGHWYMSFSENIVLWKYLYSNELKQTVYRDPNEVHREWLVSYKKTRNSKQEMQPIPETKPMSLEEIDTRLEKTFKFIKQFEQIMEDAKYWKRNCERAGRILEKFWPRMYSFLLMVVICSASLYYTKKPKSLP